MEPRKTRYNYATPFDVFYRYKCGYKFETYSIDEAIEKAELIHPNAGIGLWADCILWGHPDRVNVIIKVKYLIGKTHSEIFEMFDKKIDESISYKSRFDYWRPGKPY